MSTFSYSVKELVDLSAEEIRELILQEFLEADHYYDRVGYPRAPTSTHHLRLIVLDFLGETYNQTATRDLFLTVCDIATEISANVIVAHCPESNPAIHE